MDLLSYLQRYEPEELVRVGPHDFKTRTHGSLCISDNGFWNWTSRGFGGRTALKYLTDVKLVPFPQAVRLLDEGRCGDVSIQQALSFGIMHRSSAKIATGNLHRTEPRQNIAQSVLQNVREPAMLRVKRKAARLTDRSCCKNILFSKRFVRYAKRHSGPKKVNVRHTVAPSARKNE